MITSWIKNSKKKLLYTDKKLFISKLPTIEPFLILLSYSPLWVLQLSLRFPGCPKSGLFHKWLFLPRVCDLTLTYPKYPSLWVYNIKPSLILSTHRPGFTIGLSLIPNANQPGLQLVREPNAKNGILLNPRFYRINYTFLESSTILVLEMVGPQS